jgi:hypothetical protein
MLSLYKDAWAGKASLAKSFWLVYVVTAIVINIVLAIIFHFLGAPGNFVARLIPSLYAVFSFVCVWKCGNNSSTAWKIISRIWMILVLIGTVLTLFFPHLFMGMRA